MQDAQVTKSLGPYCLKYIVHIKISNACKQNLSGLLQIKCIISKYVFRAFSPYYLGPIIGPIPNPNYPPFFPISPPPPPQNPNLKLKKISPGNEFI